ncbi:inhibitor of growth protein 4 isoform X2 [Dermatophagoides farinae]|uniref:inhibitor of growth protein 4 isoform X2 n=1 Tax=Dermatophagoides farinae TaxID=6954 RepID=UPI003F5F5A36
MAGSYLEQFVESIQSLPCDLARNLRLINFLDTRVHEFVNSAEDLSNKYVKDANLLSSNERNEYFNQIMEYMDKAQHLTDEKKELAHQVYNMVDKHIRRLDTELAKFDIELDSQGDDVKDNVPSNSTTITNNQTMNTTQNKKKRTKSSNPSSSSAVATTTTTTTLPSSSSSSLSSTSNTKELKSSSQKHSIDHHLDSGDNNMVQKKRQAIDIQTSLSLSSTLSSSAVMNGGLTTKGKMITSTELMDMEVDPNEPLYCICHQVSFGEMVGCDDPDCQIEWFHFACVGLTSKPKGKWYCPQCTIKRKK